MSEQYIAEQTVARRERVETRHALSLQGWL